MKSQHNHSAYSIALADNVDDEQIEEESEIKEAETQNETNEENSSVEYHEQTKGELSANNQLDNSNEGDKTITNTSNIEDPLLNLCATSSDVKESEMPADATPRSTQSSGLSDGTPRSGFRRSGVAGCYSFRALPRTPSGTPRGRRRRRRRTQRSGRTSTG